MFDWGFSNLLSVWRGPHPLILKCDACHSARDFSVPTVSGVEYELTTLRYLYSLCEMVIAHVTTHGYQREFAKSQATVSD
jgi:hypothetical protein